MKRFTVVALLGLAAAIGIWMALAPLSVHALPGEWLVQNALSTGGNDGLSQLAQDRTSIVGVGIAAGPAAGSPVSSTQANMLLFRLNAETGAVSRTAVYTPAFFAPTFTDFYGPLSIVTTSNALFVAGTLLEASTIFPGLKARAAFVAKLDATFAVQTYTLWTAPTAYISASGLDANADGNIYVAGSASTNVQGENLGGFRAWMVKLDADLNRQCGAAFQSGVGTLVNRAVLASSATVHSPISPTLATPGGTASGGLVKPLVVLWDPANCTVQKSYLLDGADNRFAFTAAWAPNGSLYMPLQFFDLSNTNGSPVTGTLAMAIISPTSSLTPTIIAYPTQDAVGIVDIRAVLTDRADFRLLAVGSKVLTPSLQLRYWAAFDPAGNLLTGQTYGDSGSSDFITVLTAGTGPANDAALPVILGGSTDQDLAAGSPQSVGGRDVFVQRTSLDIRQKTYLPVILHTQ